MTAIPDFIISSDQLLSFKFRQKNVFTFQQAASFVRELPYGRNTNKYDALSIFKDGRGTCSTKHAVLKSLATKNNFAGLKLMIGIFKMTPRNTPKVSVVLAKYNLDYIPEAHCYLMFDEDIIDCTKRNSSSADFASDLLTSVEIEPNQVGDFKVAHHKNFLESWRAENDITHSLDELWEIREECIASLAD